MDCLRKIIITLGVFLGASAAFAETYPVQGPSAKQIKAMAAHNNQVAREWMQTNRNQGEVLPFHEWDKTGYVVMSDDDYWGMAKHIKNSIAEHLPDGVTLLIYTLSNSKSHHQKLKDYYKQYLTEERFKVLTVPRSGSNQFWTRDNTPIPIWQDGQFALVDAKYYYNFEPDKYFSQLLGGNLLQHPYFFEGGNFSNNSRGDCVVVNRKRSYPGGVSDTAAIPDEIFRDYYGCAKLIRFKHIKGIGHADEVVKFIRDDIVVTDTPEYVERLKAEGYQVHMLPEPERNYETYVNSLIVNNTIFVPVFGESGDDKALKVYEDLNLGYKIVPVQSRRLSTRGQGSIHCITMNYPPVPLLQLVQRLGVEVL